MTLRSVLEIGFGLLLVWMGSTVLRRKVKPQTGAALARMRSIEFRRNAMATLLLIVGIGLFAAGILAR